MRLHLRPWGVSQNESFHPKLESQSRPDENPESQQTLGPFFLERAVARQLPRPSDDVFLSFPIEILVTKRVWIKRMKELRNSINADFDQVVCVFVVYAHLFTRVAKNAKSIEDNCDINQLLKQRALHRGQITQCCGDHPNC